MSLVVEEQKQIRELARQFALEQLRPHTERWDRDGELDAGVLARLGELGFFGMCVPETHGGMGFGLPSYVAALEELARGEAAVALCVAMNDTVTNLLLRHGTDAQRHAWLEKLAAGEALGALAAAEDEAGSDLLATKTHATRSGEVWRIRGEKRWVTNGVRADFALVLARTGDAPDALGLFLVRTGDARWVVVRRETTLGLRPLELVTVRLDDAQVPADALVGGPAVGLAALESCADEARLAIAAVALGIAGAALEHARAYAAERQQFGSALRTFQGIQFKLADMAMRTAAGRALTNVAAEQPVAGLPAMAKVVASETAMWVTTQAVQIFGGYGYMRDYPVEKLMRDAKATEILGGTNEELRVRIAEALYAT